MATEVEQVSAKRSIPPVDTITPFWREAFDPAVRPFGSYRASSVFSALTRVAQNESKGAFASVLQRLQATLIKSPRLLIDTSHMGLNLRLSPAYYSQERGLLKTGHHPEEQSYEFVEGCRDQDMTFVDVGANTGLYSLMAANLSGSGARIVAIEPDPNTFHKLSFHVAANGFEDKIAVLRCAVGDVTGELELFKLVDNDLGQNSLLTPTQASRAASSTKVPVETLADIAKQQQLSRIDYLKIDVEGFEDQALGPFLSVAPKTLWPRNVLIEVKCKEIWRRDIVADMLTNGYVIKRNLDDNSWLTFAE